MQAILAIMTLLALGVLEKVLFSKYSAGTLYVTKKYHVGNTYLSEIIFTI